MERKLREINKTNRKKDTRKFYKDVRNLSNLPTTITLVSKDKEENMLSGKNETNSGKMAAIFRKTTKP